MPEIKPEKSKNPGGRPTKFKPEYCEAIVEFMGQGYSKTAFAGSIGVSRDTILEWAKGYPEFSGAARASQRWNCFRPIPGRALPLVYSR